MILILVLRKKYGNFMKLISKKEIEKPKETYNLHIENDHNYIANDAVVSNCHMAKADVLKKILTQNITKAPVRWGLTGTVPKEDFNFENIRVSIGNVVGRVHARELQDKGVLSSCHVNIVQTAEYKEFKTYPEELKYLVTNKERMEYVSGLINKISESGNTLILIDRIECGNILKENLSNLTGSEVVFVSGSMKTKDRKEEYKEVAVSNDKIIIATYGVAAVGINIPRIFNLVLIEPGKSFVRVIQSIGRGIRKADDKDFVQVWDITGSTKRAKQHLTERKRYYKEAQYPFTIEKVKYN